MMIKTEYFWIRRDLEAPPIQSAKNFDRKNYPYFITKEIFEQMEDSAAFYSGRIIESDILFEPTFLIHDRLQQLFKFLEPELEFVGVQLLNIKDAKNSAMPLYWLPYLEISEVISDKSKIIQGKVQKLFLDENLIDNEEIAEKRILHCKLPAEDIWLINLEAAECLLRREPIGINLEKISIL